MTEIIVHLFSKPEVEIDLEKARPKDFKKFGNELKERLDRISEITEKLENNSWERSAGLYDLTFYKKIKLSETKKELEKLGIDEKEVFLDDFDEEGEIEDQELEKSNNNE